MNTFYKYYDDISSRLQQAGEFIPLTLLRVILFWEFWESGVSKLRGGKLVCQCALGGLADGVPVPVRCSTDNG